MEKNEVHCQREDLNMKNKALRDVQREWMENIVNRYVEQNRDVVFSHPFFFGIPEALENQSCVMIVGQEPDDFDFYSRDMNLEKLQQWVIDYLMVQIEETTGKINPSPFWEAFRLMRKAGKYVLWNNIDKMHRLKIENGKNKTIILSRGDEEELNRPYGKENRSLLQREIEIVHPIAIWLAIGPYREEAIEDSFGLSKGILNSYRPCKNNWLCEIGKHLNLDIPVYWTYHPKYLNFLKALPDCVQQITATQK